MQMSWSDCELDRRRIGRPSSGRRTGGSPDRVPVRKRDPPSRRSFLGSASVLLRGGLAGARRRALVLAGVRTLAGARALARALRGARAFARRGTGVARAAAGAVRRPDGLHSLLRGLLRRLRQYRIEGQKTAAFEIVDVLGDAPHAHCIPVGNAGNISAYWKGYLEYREAGLSTRLPAMMGFQAAGAAPIVLGHPVENPDTIATAIRIGNPASWYGATAAASESGGGIYAVTDDDILDAYRFLASTEAVFCEPASAASVAGLLKYGLPEGASSVVCTLTGHGLKDPDRAIAQIAVPSPVDADIEAVRAELGL